LTATVEPSVALPPPPPPSITTSNLADLKNLGCTPAPDAYSAICEAWQDDQIQRHFGPMAIDTFADLLCAPLARRAGDTQREQSILLVGRGAWDAALDHGLVENGAAAFRIHVTDPKGSSYPRYSNFPHDSPRHDFTSSIDFPNDPKASDGLIELLHPDALVSQDSLSPRADIDAWLPVFSVPVDARAFLVFSEGTGIENFSYPKRCLQLVNVLGT
jgi:hypothetical protein